MKAPFQRGLVALATRRTAGLVLAAWALALGAIFVFADWSPPSAWIETSRTEHANALLRAGLVRQGAWLTFLFALVPVLVHRSASRAATWRRNDGAWLASRSVSTRTIFASTWLGASIASSAFALMFAVLGEVRGGASVGAPRLLAELDGHGSHWIEHEKPFEWRLELPPSLASSIDGNDPNRARAVDANSRLEDWKRAESRQADSQRAESQRAESKQAESQRAESKPADSRYSGAEVSGSASDTFVHVDVGLGAGAGAACEVNLRARRSEDAANEWGPIVSAHIGNRGALEIAIPRGKGALELQLSTPSEGARVLLFGERFSVWRTTSSALSVVAAILTRVVLALTAWHAIALAFSTWMSAASATCLVFALWIPAWWSSEALSSQLATYVPGADIFDALAIVADGRAPADVDARMFVGWIVIVLASSSIGVLGLRSWKVAR